MQFAQIVPLALAASYSVASVKGHADECKLQGCAEGAGAVQAQVTPPIQKRAEEKAGSSAGAPAATPAGNSKGDEEKGEVIGVEVSEAIVDIKTIVNNGETSCITSTVPCSTSSAPTSSASPAAPKKTESAGTKERSPVVFIVTLSSVLFAASVLTF